MSKFFRRNRAVGLLGLMVLGVNLLLAACGDPTPALNITPVINIASLLPGGQTPTPTTPAATTAKPATTTTLATTTANPVTTATSTVVAVSRYNPTFAAYREPASSVKANFPKYTVNANLGNVTNLTDFKLSDAQKKLLGQNYFVVEPAKYKQFYQAYESFRYDQIPTYVSTDSVAHVYHLLFDKMLRETEKTYLIKYFNSLSKALYTATLKQYNAVKGTDLEQASLRAVAYSAVAVKLGDPKATTDGLPAAANSLVTAEMKLIDATGGFAVSPIMGSDYKEDYSQYIPRGHYTKSDDLKNYFRGMMWLGRMNFRLSVPSETQTALLLSQAVQTGSADNRKAADLWQLIYEPTSFFVGTSDDLTYLDYSSLAKGVWGDAALSNPAAFADKTKLAVFVKSAEALPPPKINSMFTLIQEDRETQIKGMRVMGQRFTIDAYIFQNMIWRQVGTQDKPRDLPKGLDIFAALGSDQALKLLQQQGENNFANYTTQMTKMKTQMSNINNDTWTQNLYWAWIYNLKPLTEKRGEGYPAYMQNEAWQNKQLVAGLGSWTELKHDTILYSKQVYAERGGGPEDLPVGFVEPEVSFYARMYALAQMTRTGLEQRNMIDSQYSDILRRLEDASLRLKTISEKELSGQKLSDDEIVFLAYWGATIESFTMAATDSDEANGRKYLDNQDAALVADVATGLTDVLTEATGRINLIYVVVPANGKLVLTQGAVYSQYEFTVKPSGRLTDEAWQKMLNDGKAPALEDWKKSYMANGPIR